MSELVIIVLVLLSEFNDSLDNNYDTYNTAMSLREQSLFHVYHQPLSFSFPRLTVGDSGTARTSCLSCVRRKGKSESRRRGLDALLGRCVETDGDWCASVLWFCVKFTLCAISFEFSFVSHSGRDICKAFTQQQLCLVYTFMRKWLICCTTTALSSSLSGHSEQMKVLD